MTSEEKKKRLIEDGISIGMISQDEIDRLIESNKDYLKSINLDEKTARAFAGMDVSNFIFIAGIKHNSDIRLVPELMRIAANALDIMVQNTKRDKDEKIG